MINIQKNIAGFYSQSSKFIPDQPCEAKAASWFILPYCFSCGQKKWGCLKSFINRRKR